MSAASAISGLVLCHIGSQQVAFFPEEISLIESSRGARAMADKISAGGAKALISVTGQAFIVDSLEIDSERRALLEPPVLLRSASSLRGFVELGQKLCPVYSLDAFARFAAARGAAK